MRRWVLSLDWRPPGRRWSCSSAFSFGMRVASSPPIVTGTVVLLIGLTLLQVGATNVGGGFGAKSNGTFGSLTNLGMAVLVLGTGADPEQWSIAPPAHAVGDPGARRRLSAGRIFGSGRLLSSAFHPVDCGSDTLQVRIRISGGFPDSICIHLPDYGHRVGGRHDCDFGIVCAADLRPDFSAASCAAAYWPTD